MDMREAQRSYEADLTVMDATKQMLARTVDLLRSLRRLDHGPFPPPQPPPTGRSPRSAPTRRVRAGQSRAADVPAPAISRDFLSGALKDCISTMKPGRAAATQQVAGQGQYRRCGQAVNAAEITLDTVVAVRDKVVQAYQSIMNMPI